MTWSELVTREDLADLIRQSHSTPCLIFKHSTRCNISAIARYRIESDWAFEAHELQPYFLDLLRYRALSDEIADVFQTYHESPQVLLIHKGECFYDASHLDISVEELKEIMSSFASA